MTYGLDKKRLTKKEFTCVMCKTYCIGQYRYVWNTYQILPKTPSEKLIICTKCAIRESNYKNKKDLEENCKL